MFHLGGLYSNSSSESDLELFHQQPRRQPRRRLFKPRINFELPATDRQERFRLTDGHIDAVVREIGGFIQHPTDRNAALTPRQQIELSLRFLSTGNYYRVVGDAHGVHKSTLSRTLHRFVRCVNQHLTPRLVDFPDAVTMAAAVEEFRNKAGMPAVFGCIDGTHINIRRPSQNEAQFVNRHQDHSLNCMLVCGPELQFYYVNSRMPGSASDQRVFRTSNLYQRLQGGWRPYPEGYLLGDSGYAVTDFLLPPLLQANTEQEQAYNRAHKKTRRLIECAIGVFKQRFRCMLRTMELEPVFVAEIVRCCAALHNLLMSPEDRLAAQFVNVVEPEEAPAAAIGGNNNRRQQIIALF